MKAALKIFAALLLLFNGTGAVYGGYSFIAHPDGSSLGMNLTYLEHSPFGSYLVPGIVLLVMNGICSFAVLTALLFRYRHAALLVAAQGAVLCGWIGVQLLLVRMIYYLHFVLGATGILLMVSGYLLWRIQKQKSS